MGVPRHRKLAATLAARIAHQLDEIMGDVEKSVKNAGEARYVVTITFKDTGSALGATIKGKPTYTLPSIDVKLEIDHGQLGLFEPPAVDAPFGEEE